MFLKIAFGETIRTNHFVCVRQDDQDLQDVLVSRMNCRVCLQKGLARVSSYRPPHPLLTDCRIFFKKRSSRSRGRVLENGMTELYLNASVLLAKEVPDGLKSGRCLFFFFVSRRGLDSYGSCPDRGFCPDLFERFFGGFQKPLFSGRSKAKQSEAKRIKAKQSEAKRS